MVAVGDGDGDADGVGDGVAVAVGEADGDGIGVTPAVEFNEPLNDSKPDPEQLLNKKTNTNDPPINSREVNCWRGFKIVFK